MFVPLRACFAAMVSTLIAMGRVAVEERYDEPDVLTSFMAVHNLSGIKADVQKSLLAAAVHALGETLPFKVPQELYDGGKRGRPRTVETVVAGAVAPEVVEQFRQSAANAVSSCHHGAYVLTLRGRRSERMKCVRPHSVSPAPRRIAHGCAYLCSRWWERGAVAVAPPRQLRRRTMPDLTTTRCSSS